MTTAGVLNALSHQVQYSVILYGYNIQLRKQQQGTRISLTPEQCDSIRSKGPTMPKVILCLNCTEANVEMT